MEMVTAIELLSNNSLAYLIKYYLFNTYSK